MEGGTPNVYSEALNHGCKIITSNIDAAEEMTNYGKLGYIYQIDDYEGLSKCMLQLDFDCKNKDFDQHIEKCLKYANENFDWYTNAKKLAFMLNN